MSQRITIDPVTRIEGHLRIDCEIEDGKVIKAWSSGTMWRGMEEILQGNDPRRCLDDCAAHLRRLYHHSRHCFSAGSGKCIRDGSAS
ncbi:hypothetical protein [Yersinia enterocolitica]|uniref:hypothetical protein n=1 Tax=Yersinia enterocolitica TaxID=630 RepID=UPI0021B62E1A|nr:hypothetical protein [Yersinia enterocolitica]